MAAARRAPVGRRLLALVTGLLVVAAPALAGCGEAAPERGGAIQGPNGADLFAGAGSIWHQPVPADAQVDPRSAEYVRQLVGTFVKNPPVVSVNGWTVPVYEAGPETPRYRVTATEDFVQGGWTLPAVPIPAEAEPDSKDDGHMVVIDRTAGCVYEFWQAKPVVQGQTTTWTTAWVNATPVDGTGTYPDGLAARGTGISAAGGLIWPQELAAGRIDHALLFAYQNTRRDAIVAPATTTDGRAGPDVAGLPAGARLRLDPAVDVDRLGLTAEQRTIAVALQRYGMILGDTSGGFTLYAAAPQSYVTFPYPTDWASSRWADIQAIPFDKLQVLALPAPSRPPTTAPVLNRCTRDAVHGEGLGSGHRADTGEDD